METAASSNIVAALRHRHVDALWEVSGILFPDNIFFII